MAVAEGTKRSDLPVRTASAVVMVAVAAGALWLGGLAWAILVSAIALGVLWEWRALVVRFVRSPMARGLWNAGGIVYIGGAAAMLYSLNRSVAGGAILIALLLAVVLTDVGAYFFGRTLGGPKIAPRISPSKTWAGLLGGIVGASIVVFVAAAEFAVEGHYPELLLLAAAIAVLAQAGDFFESWMKRRAGVKDSGWLLPGHGGLFDRVDGLMAVAFVYGLTYIGNAILTGQLA